MLKILVLSHFFPPYENVQSKINLSTVYAMLDRGLQPVVVASRVSSDHINSDTLK